MISLFIFHARRKFFVPAPSTQHKCRIEINRKKGTGLDKVTNVFKIIGFDMQRECNKGCAQDI